jgi:pimeloyl-ACP methyl ester carboxylesterase
VTNNDKRIDVEGLPVHYLESGAGNGRALLLLHGGIGDARANWSQVLPPLAEKYHVFAPDLPGFGTPASGATAGLPDLSVEKLLHWMQALLDALGQSEAVVLGASTGGMLARLFAAAAPQYVPAIILVNGGTLTDDLRESWRAAAPAFAELMRAMLLYHYPEKQAPPVPTLLLWGANDPIMPLALAERTKAEIPGAVLAPIADCGHMPQIEASEAFVFQVTAYLEGLTRARTTNLPGVGILRSD